LILNASASVPVIVLPLTEVTVAGVEVRAVTKLGEKLLPRRKIAVPIGRKQAHPSAWQPGCLRRARLGISIDDLITSNLT